MLVHLGSKKEPNAQQKLSDATRAVAVQKHSKQQASLCAVDSGHFIAVPINNIIIAEAELSEDNIQTQPNHVTITSYVRAQASTKAVPNWHCNMRLVGVQHACLSGESIAVGWWDTA